MTGRAVVVAEGDRIRFQDGTQLIYTPPRDTIDPRYDACTDHHVACDCREAEHQEWQSEASGYNRLMREVFARVLADHQTRVVLSDPFTDPTNKPCMCTGCQIAREIGVYP